MADVVAATLAAATARDVTGRAFNVGGGSRVSLMEAIELIGELSGGAAEVRHLPIQDGDVRDTGADISLAAAALQYEPATRLPEGLRAEFEWVTATASRAR